MLRVGKFTICDEFGIPVSSEWLDKAAVEKKNIRFMCECGGESDGKACDQCGERM